MSRRLSRWTPLQDQLVHRRARPWRKRNPTTEYTIAYVGAKCALEYSAVKRPKGKFYVGHVAHIHAFAA